MSYQQVRGVYEQLVITALAPLRVVALNQPTVNTDALTEYAQVRVSFGETTELTIGCEPMEHLRGVLVCEVYSRKGEGPGRGLVLILPAVKALNRLNLPFPQPDPAVTARVGPINGPAQLALDGRPHLMTRFSCPVIARWEGP